MAARSQVPPAQIHGDVVPGFGLVADTFRAQLAERQAIGAACISDPDALAPRLARQAPLWEPGSRQGYHVGGVGNARGIARAYGELATGGGRLGLRPATLTALETPAAPPPGGRRDLVLHSDIPFSLGYARAFPGFPLGTDQRSYAMAGAGGSIGMADPALGVGFAYTPNRMGFGSPTDPREVALRDALYRCLDGPRQDPRAHRDTRVAAR